MRLWTSWNPHALPVGLSRWGSSCGRQSGRSRGWLCLSPAGEAWVPSQVRALSFYMPSNRLILSCPLSCPQSFPATGSFPMSWLFTSGGESIGASLSASVFPRNIQDWFPLGLTGLILQSKGLSSLLQHHSSKASILQHSAVFTVQLSHPYMTTGKTIALTRWTFVGKVMSLFNMLSRFVIAFLPRSKHFLISWLQSRSSVNLEPKKITPVTVSTFPPFICHQLMGLDLVFSMLNFKTAFSLSSFPFKRLFSSFSLSAIRAVSSTYLRLLVFLLAILIPACEPSSPAFSMIYSV